MPWHWEQTAECFADPALSAKPGHRTQKRGNALVKVHRINYSAVERQELTTNLFRAANKPYLAAHDPTEKSERREVNMIDI